MDNVVHVMCSSTFSNLGRIAKIANSSSFVRTRFSTKKKKKEKYYLATKSRKVETDRI